MAYERPEESPIDYHYCRYGKSKSLFRGPKRNLTSNTIAFLGGSETFGRYIESPFVAQVEEAIGNPCINFGTLNAGIDAFVNDSTVIDHCCSAKATVIQILGAQNMSNRFYTVHPRRNDRFLKASVIMQTIYREVDFTDFSFTRHMLGTLRAISPGKFEAVEAELKCAWVARMESLLRQIKSPKILLWIKDKRNFAFDDGFDLGHDPLFVDEDMIDALRLSSVSVVEIDIGPDVPENSMDGMLYPPMENASAERMLGRADHATISEEIVKVL